MHFLTYANAIFELKSYSISYFANFILVEFCGSIFYCRLPIFYLCIYAKVRFWKSKIKTFSNFWWLHPLNLHYLNNFVYFLFQCCCHIFSSQMLPFGRFVLKLHFESKISLASHRIWLVPGRISKWHCGFYYCQICLAF